MSIRNRLFVKNCIVFRIILDENKVDGNHSTSYGKTSIFYITIHMNKSNFYMAS